MLWFPDPLRNIASCTLGSLNTSGLFWSVDCLGFLLAEIGEGAWFWVGLAFGNLPI